MGIYTISVYGIAMSENLYELRRIIERARAWRHEGDVAHFAEMRALCLDEATRCEEIVRRSLETPPLLSNSGKL